MEKKMENKQRLRLLYLYRMLSEKTDDDHSINIQEIIAELDAYDIKAERKTIYADIRALKDFGVDIIGQKVGHGYEYHIGVRRFELAELKLLVDAVQSSRFITQKKSNELIKKLEAVASVHQAKELQRQVFVSERIKTMNESIYYNIDIIHSAINDNRKIRFQYFNWNADKEQELRHGGELYSVSPWGVCWNDEWYYLIGFDDKTEQIRHYRVDKMKKISLSDERRAGRESFKSLDIALYTKKRFSMFDGEEERVHLLCRNTFAGIIIDRFGKDIPFRRVDDDHFEVTVEVAVSGLFIGWIIGLGDGIQITGPQHVKDMMKEEIHRLSDLYNG